MSLLARSDFPNAFEFVFQGFSFQSNERMKAELIKTFFLKKWDKPGLFFIYFQSFQTNNTILQQINVKNVQMYIQFTALEFEPTTFRT